VQRPAAPSGFGTVARRGVFRSKFSDCPEVAATAPREHPRVKKQIRVTWFEPGPGHREESRMKRFVGLVSLIAATGVAALCVGPAVGSSINFTGTYSGKVTEVVNGNAVTATPKGKGKATLIGRGTMTGTVAGTTSNPPCTPLSGPGILKGTRGTLKLKLLTGSRACAAGSDDQNNISFSGYARVTGGTGALKRATGKLHYSGHYDRGTGAFNVKLTGTLKH
jgi:hypothetical protein